jgi:putative tricarboxylic transport membrane protein
MASSAGPAAPSADTGQVAAREQPGSRLARLGPYLVLLAATSFLFADSLRIRSTTTSTDLGAAFWPRAILALLLLCTLLRLAIVARERRVASAAAAADEPPADLRAVAIAFGLIVAYVWLSATIGFALATFGYLLVMAFVLGCRNRVVPLAVALSSTLVLLYFFVRFVYVPLPLGDGVWAELSVALFHTLGLY